MSTILQFNVTSVSRFLIGGRLSVSEFKAYRYVIVTVVIKSYRTFRQLPTVARQSTLP